MVSLVMMLVPSFNVSMLRCDVLTAAAASFAGARLALAAGCALAAGWARFATRLRAGSARLAVAAFAVFVLALRSAIVTFLYAALQQIGKALSRCKSFLCSAAKVRGFRVRPRRRSGWPRKPARPLRRWPPA